MTVRFKVEDNGKLSGDNKRNARGLPILVHAEVAGLRSIDQYRAVLQCDVWLRESENTDQAVFVEMVVGYGFRYP